MEILERKSDEIVNLYVLIHTHNLPVENLTNKECFILGLLAAKKLLIQRGMDDLDAKTRELMGEL